QVDQIAVDRVLDQELALAVIHRHRPEGVDRRELPGGEGKGVVVLAAVERFSCRSRACKGIHGFGAIISVDSRLGSARTQQPIAAVKTAVAKELTNATAVASLR